MYPAPVQCLPPQEILTRDMNIVSSRHYQEPYVTVPHSTVLLGSTTDRHVINYNPPSVSACSTPSVGSPGAPTSCGGTPQSPISPIHHYSSNHYATPFHQSNQHQTLHSTVSSPGAIENNGNRPPSDMTVLSSVARPASVISHSSSVGQQSIYQDHSQGGLYSPFVSSPQHDSRVIKDNFYLSNHESCMLSTTSCLDTAGLIKTEMVSPSHEVLSDIPSTYENYEGRHQELLTSQACSSPPEVSTCIQRTCDVIRPSPHREDSFHCMKQEKSETDMSSQQHQLQSAMLPFPSCLVGEAKFVFSLHPETQTADNQLYQHQQQYQQSFQDQHHHHQHMNFGHQSEPSFSFPAQQCNFQQQNIFSTSDVQQKYNELFQTSAFQQGEPRPKLIRKRKLDSSFTELSQHGCHIQLDQPSSSYYPQSVEVQCIRPPPPYPDSFQPTQYVESHLLQSYSPQNKAPYSPTQMGQYQQPARSSSFIDLQARSEILPGNVPPSLSLQQAKQCPSSFLEPGPFQPHKRRRQNRNNSGNKPNSLAKPQQDRPYRCSHCEKRFSRTDELHRHMRIHTGKQMFSVVCLS